MKRAVLCFFFLLFSTTVNGQDWLTDKDFEKSIVGNSAFDDLDVLVVVEFWAEFNDDNSFKDWGKLTGVKYYRADISENLKAKKKYRVRMAPTIIVFDKDGFKYAAFKAGLDLVCPVTLEELQLSIDDCKRESQF